MKDVSSKKKMSIAIAFVAVVSGGYLLYKKSANNTHTDSTGEQAPTEEKSSFDLLAPGKGESQSSDASAPTAPQETAGKDSAHEEAPAAPGGMFPPQTEETLKARKEASKMIIGALYTDFFKEHPELKEESVKKISDFLAENQVLFQDLTLAMMDPSKTNEQILEMQDKLNAEQQKKLATIMSEDERSKIEEYEEGMVERMTRKRAEETLAGTNLDPETHRDTAEKMTQIDMNLHESENYPQNAGSKINVYNADNIVKNRQTTQSILNQDASFLNEPIAKMKERLNEVKKVTQNLPPEARNAIVKKAESEVNMLQAAFDAINAGKTAKNKENKDKL